jgi:hypothetical protein
MTACGILTGACYFYGSGIGTFAQSATSDFQSKTGSGQASGMDLDFLARFIFDEKKTARFLPGGFFVSGPGL